METVEIKLDRTERVPIRIQIERSIRAAVATGRLSRDAQLPTVRKLALALRVNPNTVARVYSDLERDGLVETRRGVGTFIADPSRAQPPHKPDEQSLRDFAALVLEDAAARGFSLPEFVDQLKRLLPEGRLEGQ